MWFYYKNMTCAGFPAAPWDKDSPDWVPSLHMGHETDALADNLNGLKKASDKKPEERAPATAEKTKQASGLSSTNTRRSLYHKQCQEEAKWFSDPYPVTGVTIAIVVTVISVVTVIPHAAGLSSTNTRRLLCPERCQEEAKWFSDPYAVPGLGATMPDTDHMHTFQHLLWDHPPLVTLSQYEATPEELSKLCGEGEDGCLLPCHVSWILNKLNSARGRSTMCFSMDAISPQLLTCLTHLRDLGQLKHISHLVFFMTVHRKTDGGVSVVTGQSSGCHWTVAVVDLEQGRMVYCDSLGWKEPDNLVPKTGSVLQIFQREGTVWSIFVAHESVPYPQSHVCGEKCLNYPFQPCASVSGVAAVIFTAHFVLRDGAFQDLMKCKVQCPGTFFDQPGHYSRYLRRKVIAWFAAEVIDIGFLSEHGRPKQTIESSGSPDGLPPPKVAKYGTGLQKSGAESSALMNDPQKATDHGESCSANNAQEKHGDVSIPQIPGTQGWMNKAGREDKRDMNTDTQGAQNADNANSNTHPKDRNGTGSEGNTRTGSEGNTRTGAKDAQQVDACAGDPKKKKSTHGDSNPGTEKNRAVDSDTNPGTEKNRAVDSDTNPGKDKNRAVDSDTNPGKEKNRAVRSDTNPGTEKNRAVDSDTNPGPEDEGSKVTMTQNRGQGGSKDIAKGFPRLSALLKEDNNSADDKQGTGKLCPHCNLRLGGRKTLVRHIRKQHAEEAHTLVLKQPKPSYHCCFCDAELFTVRELIQHHQTVHGKAVRIQTTSFSSKPEFEQWKKELEEKSFTRFVMERGRKRESNQTVMYLICHRSGTCALKPAEERKKAVRVKGTCKISGKCTAFLTAFCSHSGSVRVEYCVDHLGHGLELSHLHLSRQRIKHLERLSQRAGGEKYQKRLEDIYGSPLYRDTKDVQHYLREAIKTKVSEVGELVGRVDDCGTLKAMLQCLESGVATCRRLSEAASQGEATQQTPLNNTFDAA
ncbi:hypothetical protein ACOMHN_004484 [Nucella lapillus]